MKVTQFKQKILACPTQTMKEEPLAQTNIFFPKFGQHSMNRKERKEIENNKQINL